MCPSTGMQAMPLNVPPDGLTTRCGGATNDNPSNDRKALSAAGHVGALPEFILSAFEQACNDQDITVAKRLLTVLEVIERRSARPGSTIDSRTRTVIVAAHERLWTMRNG
jgi:hypothetical protein